MKNESIAPVPVAGTPKPLSKEMKLKVFAISSLHKDVDGKALVEAKKVSLTLGVAYSIPEGIEAARQGLIASGLKPEDFTVFFQGVFADADRLIEMPVASPIVAEQKKKEPDDRVSKEKGSLVAYVRYVFNAVGTKAEIATAEKVIKKFEDNNTKS